MLPKPSSAIADGKDAESILLGGAGLLRVIKYEWSYFGIVYDGKHESEVGSIGAVTRIGRHGSYAIHIST